MKKVINKRLAAIIIITLIMAVFFGIMTVLVTGNIIMENAIETAPYAFNGIYGGIGGKALELAHHMPEYEWLVGVNNILNNLFGIAVCYTIPVTFIVASIEDWLYVPASK